MRFKCFLTYEFPKECGFCVSIDDFGAGLSSLNRISTIEADVLKLDKAFFGLEGKETIRI